MLEIALIFSEVIMSLKMDFIVYFTSNIGNRVTFLKFIDLASLNMLTAGNKSLSFLPRGNYFALLRFYIYTCMRFLLSTVH